MDFGFDDNDDPMALAAVPRPVFVSSSKERNSVAWAVLLASLVKAYLHVLGLHAVTVSSTKLVGTMDCNHCVDQGRVQMHGIIKFVHFF